MASLVERVHQDTEHTRREGKGDTLEDDLADTAEGLEVALAAKLLEPQHFVLHNHNSDTELGHKWVAELEVALDHRPGRAIPAGAHEASRLQHQPPVAEPSKQPILAADCSVAADQEVKVDKGEQAE